MDVDVDIATNGFSSAVRSGLGLGWSWSRVCQGLSIEVQVSTLLHRQDAVGPCNAFAGKRKKGKEGKERKEKGRKGKERKSKGKERK